MAASLRPKLSRVAASSAVIRIRYFIHNNIQSGKAFPLCPTSGFYVNNHNNHNLHTSTQFNFGLFKPIDDNSWECFGNIKSVRKYWSQGPNEGDGIAIRPGVKFIQANDVVGPNTGSRGGSQKRVAGSKELSSWISRMKYVGLLEC